MPTFEISRATSLSFKIETGTGTVNDGATIADNYLWADVLAHYNASEDCRCVIHDDYLQKFTTADTVTFQINYDNSPKNPRVIVLDQDDSTIEVVALANSSGTYRDYTIDFTDSSLYSAGNCYKVEIYTDDLSSNLFTHGDNGTHETGVAGLQTGQDLGGNNTLAQSAAQAESGSNSALITAHGTPTINHRLIYANGDTSTYTLTSGTTYQVEAYIYNPSGTPWIGTNNFNLLANFDGSFGDQTVPVLTGFTDATIHTQGTAATSISDTWTVMATVFTVNSVTTGSIVITSDDIPNASGTCYVDTVTLYALSDVLEAESEPITLQTSHTCHSKFTWTNSDDGFKMDYTNNHVNSTWLDAQYFKFRVVDPDYETHMDDDSVHSVITSTSEKVHTLEIAKIPPYMVEKIILALKHDTVTIAGIQYVSVDPDITPEWEGELAMANITTEVKRQDYKYQNSTC